MMRNLMLHNEWDGCDWIPWTVLFIRAWPGRHFQPGSKSEYLDVLFARSRYEL